MHLTGSFPNRSDNNKHTFQSARFLARFLNRFAERRFSSAKTGFPANFISRNFSGKECPQPKRSRTPTADHLCQVVAGIDKKNTESPWKQRPSAFFVASLPGFEPGAFRLGGGPSILLRYKDKYSVLVQFPYSYDSEYSLRKRSLYPEKLWKQAISHKKQYFYDTLFPADCQGFSCISAFFWKSIEISGDLW